MSLEDERASFLHAIRENPDDDSSRLIYADWLDEHMGDLPDEARNEQSASARAEFIRLQCRLSHMPRDNPLRAQLKRRADQLLGKHREAWTQPLHACLPDSPPVIHVTFSHGFPSGVTLYRETDLRYAGKLAAVEPLQEIHLDLRFSDIGDAEARALAFSPHLGQLTHLDLGNNRIGDDGARALASSPHLNHLTNLDLTRNGIGVEGARALTSSPHLNHLRSLGLAWNGIGDEGARALASSQHLQHLTHLDLRGNHISDEEARALAFSPHLQHLTSLDLGGNRIGEAVRREINREMARRREQAGGRGA